MAGPSVESIPDRIFAQWVDTVLKKRGGDRAYNYSTGAEAQKLRFHTTSLPFFARSSSLAAPARPTQDLSYQLQSSICAP